MRRKDLTRCNANPHCHAHVIGHLDSIHADLARESTLRGPKRRRRQITLGRLPERDQRVACKLDDVPIVLGDHINQLAEIGIEETRQVLRSGRAALGQALGERSESGNICKEDGGRKVLGDRRGQRSQIGPSGH